MRYILAAGWCCQMKPVKHRPVSTSSIAPPSIVSQDNPDLLI